MNHKLVKPSFTSFQQKRLSEAARSVLRYTCQLFIFKPETGNRPHPDGCGVLVSIHNQYYCLSNAHVLCDGQLNNTFVLLGGGKTMSIGGMYYNTTLPVSGRRKEDPLDIAAVHLQAECAEGLLSRGYDFLDGSSVLTGHTPSHVDRLLVAGYPGNKTKLDIIGKGVHARPFILISHPFLKDLSKINFPKDHHFLTHYSRSRINDISTDAGRMGPLPHGISGSGLWLLKTDGSGRIHPHLIGIQSKYLENRALLASTKIDLYMDILRQKVDPTINNTGVGVQLLNH